MRTLGRLNGCKRVRGGEKEDEGLMLPVSTVSTVAVSGAGAGHAAPPPTSIRGAGRAGVRATTR